MMVPHKTDVLAFGAHADDVEIGMAGTISKWVKQGKNVVICDLTEAELSSNGTTKQRKIEAEKAATLMGISRRLNLQLPDRGLYLQDEYIKKIVAVIRTYQPDLVFAPTAQDRHPDHGHCGTLVKEAIFSAGIRKYEANADHPAHKVKGLYYYFINGRPEPDFLIDISNEMDQKISILQAYESQFFQSKDGVATPLTDGYIESIVAREKLFGKDVGVAYAEGFQTTQPLLISEDIFGEKR